MPVDDQDPSIAGKFVDLLARAYALGEGAGVKNMLRNRGLALIERQEEADHILVRRYRRFPELKGVELDP